MSNCQGATTGTSFNFLHLGVGTAGALCAYAGLNRLLAVEGIPQQLTQIGLRFWGCGAVGLGCAFTLKLVTDGTREEEISDEARRQLQEAQANLGQANRARRALEAERLSLRMQVAGNFRARIVQPNEREAQIATLEAEKKQVGTSLERAKAEVGKLKGEIRSLQATELAQRGTVDQLSALQAEKKKVDASLLKAKAEVGKLKGEVQDSRAQAELARKEVEAQLSALQAEKKEVDASLLKAKAEVGKLKGEVQDSRAQAELARKEVEAQLSALQAEKKKVDASLLKAKAEVGELKGEIRDSEAQVERAELAQKEVEAQLSALQEKEEEGRGKLVKTISQIFSGKGTNVPEPEETAGEGRSKLAKVKSLFMKKRK